MKRRNTFDYIKLFFKGIFMGIADAIPGVSGGTIALLLGIYEELIHTISSLNFEQILYLRKNGFKSFWSKINGGFLFSLLLGIGVSLISFVKISAILLDKYPLFVWSFFLGLIIATVYVIYKLIEKLNFRNILFVLISIMATLLLSSFSTVEINNIGLLYILFCGIIASSAMILPGISGSLILVILGVYTFLINALNNLEILIIITFILGAIIGLLGFSRVLKYLFNNYRNITYSIMLGLVIGSIPKILKITLFLIAEPWNKYLTAKVNNIDIVISIILMLCGFSLILILDKKTKK
jgi:putative membrane protein